MENSSSLIVDLQALPKPYDLRNAERGLENWAEAAREDRNKAWARWMQSVGVPEHPLYPLLAALFGNSPYLSRLLLQHPQILYEVSRSGFDLAWGGLLQELAEVNVTTELMRHLRVAKGKAALLIAMADITQNWALPQVTGALSELADRCLTLALDSLLETAQKRGEVELENPKESGIIILGMGKLGGRELNYSSDIDLIILFEPGRVNYKGRLSEQKFMTRLSYDLVALMQERTPHGYVFRTDLRLRPDPASTPTAISVDAAYTYYESVGQNWERAAMIKARPVAGDIAAGERFLKGLTPFMWRRNLDFAAISDIHSIKRQMDSRQDSQIQLKNYNIKLGQGGIREIEFFVQIHQLIWGGREPVLRTRATCETLVNLSDYGLVDGDIEQLLHNAYAYFRKLEHRLQMIDDAQTHSLPGNEEGLRHVACFMGYDLSSPSPLEGEGRGGGTLTIEKQDPLPLPPSLKGRGNSDFTSDLLSLLTQVHTIYASSFKNDKENILSSQGNLVFTGPSHDPETLETLRDMGFLHPEAVSEIVMGWHHGSCRATRTKRARELLTEMMPLLLTRLSETANAQAAFLKFNEFLVNLPSGVQLFSLFNANPHLLGLIADIMGSAPTLAENLSKSPELLDAVLYDDFYANLPSPAALSNQLNEILASLSEVEIALDRIRYFRNEKQFQAGVQLLKGMITAQDASRFLSHLTDLVLQKTYAIICEEFVKIYGIIDGTEFAVLALGKLGSQEMTFSSDIDLVFIYDAADFDRLSNGEKGLSSSVYFNRLAQRFVGCLSAMGKSGRLYEVDTRLRPSGKQGLLAVSMQAIAHYFDELAWTFEYMAFTKARVVIAGPVIREHLDDFIHRQLVKPRDAAKLKSDAEAMRERIEKSHATKDRWDIKYVRGGLMDVDFIAQYLMLLHAPTLSGAQPGGALAIFNWLANRGKLDKDVAESLKSHCQFLSIVFNMLRLCTQDGFDEKTAPPALKKLLAESVGEKNFESLDARLIHVEQSVFAHYIEFLR